MGRSAMATIRLHSKKNLVHRETRTFSRRAAAEKWARAREVELEDPAALRHLVRLDCLRA